MTQEQQLYIAAHLIRLIWGNTTYPYMTQNMKSFEDGLKQWGKGQGWSEEEIAEKLYMGEFHAYYIAMLLLRYICVFMWLSRQNYKEADFFAVRDILEALIEKEAGNAELFLFLYTWVMKKLSKLASTCPFDESSAEQIMSFYESDIETLIGYIPSTEMRQFFVGRLHGLLHMLEELPSNKSNGCMGWGIAAVVIGFIIWLI